MKTLAQLIADLCPNGVKYKRLSDLGTFYGGLTGKNKHDFTDGNAPYVTYMNIFSNPALSLDINDLVKVSIGERQNSIQRGDILFTGSSETPEEAGMTSVVMEEPKVPTYVNSFCFGFRFYSLNGICPGFMKHLFRSHALRKSISKTANGVTRFNISKKSLADIEIPVPPIEVQERIVEILDKFTALTAELQAELQERQRQYEYYRNRLLSFGGSDNIHSELIDTQALTPPHYKFLKMSEICIIKTGKGVTKKDAHPFGLYPIISGGKSPMEYIDVYNRNENTVTISRVGAYAGYVDYQVNKFYLNDKCFSAIPKTDTLSPKFLYYSLKNKEQQIMDLQSEGGVPTINTEKIGNIILTIPSLAEQERIVGILDRFEALCSDLSAGLPAEIEARQKQYEYYRNRLLSFPRMAN